MLSSASFVRQPSVTQIGFLPTKAEDMKVPKVFFTLMAEVRRKSCLNAALKYQKNIFTVPLPSHDLQEAMFPFCIRTKKTNQYTYFIHSQLLLTCKYVF